nr:ABC transporter permease [Actinomycetota bacterium]
MSAVRIWVDAFRGTGRETPLDRFFIRVPFYGALETARDMASLAGRVLRITLTSRGWMRDAVEEMSKALRLSFLPVVFASLIFMLAFASVILARVLNELGAGDRIGPGIYLGLTRELCTWIPMMLLTALLGSALAGDIGSRKIREELDALDVLGVDKLRTLIVPRVIGLTATGLVMSLLIVFISVSATLVANSITVQQPIVPQLQATFLVMNGIDLLGALVKNLLCGFFIGVVAAQRGLSARGGAEGVGRAVAETVVI